MLLVILNYGSVDSSNNTDKLFNETIDAVGTIGCKKSKLSYMRGYNEMLRRIEPQAIICFGKPFNEMQGNIIPIDYNSTRRVNRNGR